MSNVQVFFGLVALVAVALLGQTVLDLRLVSPDETLHAALSTLIGLLAGVLAGYRLGAGGPIK